MFVCSTLLFFCFVFVLFFFLLLVCAQTLTSQPGVDATNFARLTTDVSIYFGSTSLHYNNTISCLFICNIIFQPCVFFFPPSGYSSLSVALPELSHYQPGNRRAHSRSCLFRARCRNTTFSDNCDGLGSAVYDVSNANKRGLYNGESRRLCVAGLSFDCVMCAARVLAWEEPYFMGLRGLGLVPHY